MSRCIICMQSMEVLMYGKFSDGGLISRYYALVPRRRLKDQSINNDPVVYVFILNMEVNQSI